MIYEEDYKELCAWVLKKPNIETGGDLFGLWADKHTAVIQLVLGPGQACTRTSVSFYQDVNYLERVGSYLTQNEGVCHIGEWHSHHQLGLAKPSGGDERTVWNNMPTYNLKRFVIFIANIRSSKQSYNVNIGCFLFEIDDQGNRLDVLPGEFRILQKESPFSGKVSVAKNKGAEEDEKNTITIKDLQLEVKAGGKSPTVTYMKRLPPPKPKETPRRFKVVIYEDDYKELCAWVLKKPNIETGGDLFGLWADKHTAVIQLVLGPGQGCRRTSASFYQDIDYLQRVGSYLTQNEGVCHIGEWHSHHQMGLAQPSGGDESTVWNNMPTYNLKRFVIFIANIRSSKQNYNVHIGCFLFETDDHGNRLDVLPGEFTILQKENPLSSKKEVSEKRYHGAEKDDENKITIEDLSFILKMKDSGKSPQSLTYLKPPTPPSKKRNWEKNNQLQSKAKTNDEESSGDSKKQKMDPEASPPITPTDETIPGSGKMPSDGSLTTEDMKNLTINDTQVDERPEVAMEVEDEKEQPEKKDEEEKRDDEEKNSIVNKQNEVSDRESEKGQSKGEENEKDMKGNEETSPPEVVQQKAQRNVSDKENPSSPQQEPRPLPRLEDTTSAKQTGRQPLQVEEKAKTKVKQSSSKEGEKKIDTKQSSPHGSRPLPKLQEENKPEKKTGRQPLQHEEEAKTKAEQSSGKGAAKKNETKEGACQGARPMPKLTEQKTSSKKPEKKLQITVTSKKTTGQQRSGKKAGTSRGTGSKKGKKQD